MVEQSCDVFRRRRDIVVERVEGIDALSISAPAGAFYALIRCDELFGAKTPAGDVIHTEVDFVSHLLRRHGLAAVPGSAYGVQEFFRISTATSDHNLIEAMDRLQQCVEVLQ